MLCVVHVCMSVCVRTLSQPLAFGTMGTGAIVANKREYYDGEWHVAPACQRAFVGKALLFGSDGQNLGGSCTKHTSGALYR